MAVFFYDLLRTTRRGRVVLLRAVYALALLAALFCLYVNWLPRGGPVAGKASPSALARFAEEFVRWFLFIQLGAVVLLTPAFTAGAIAEERQRGTLDAVLTTQLTPGQIILGKLAARLAHLFGVLLTGLPVLALMPFWGGVDPGLVLNAFAVTGVTMFSLSALSLWCSASARTVRGAVAMTYAIAAVAYACPLLMFINPFSTLVALFGGRSVLSGLNGEGVTLVVTGCHGSLAVALLWMAARRLGRHERRGAPPSPGVVVAPVVPRRQSRAAFRAPPIIDRPLLWKELHFGDSQGIRVVTLVLSIVLICVAVAVSYWLSMTVATTGDDRHRANLNIVIRVFAVIILGTAAISTLLQATCSVGREREQRTLDMLLTLPEDRADVLWAKWLGSVLRGRGLLIGLLFVLVIGAIGEGVVPLALPLIAVVAAVHLAFIASLGLFLSVAVPSTGRAGFMGALVLFLACVAPVTLSPGGATWVAPVVWVQCLPGQIEDATGRSGSFDISAGCWLGLVVYGLLTVCLWYLARARFHREADRAAIA